MDKEFNDYIDIIIQRIGVKGGKARKIREDLYASLVEKQQSTGDSNPYYLLGEPEEVAAEFRENLELKNNDSYRLGYFYEYTSKTRLFGLPLICINTKPFGVAKGIISIGGIAVGLLSLGGISIGVLSLGGLSAGLLLSIGGIAFSGGMSIGGAAIAYGASIGGLAIAKYIAFGGYAQANIAIGGVTKGIVSIFDEHGTGQYMFRQPADKNQVISAIKNVYPNISKWLLSIIGKLV